VDQEAVDGIVELLDLEPIEVNIFRGVSPDDNRQRVFGGQVAGQALVAAARTIDPTEDGHLAPHARSVHSLHAYFLRAGDPEIPIIYEVERVRDGRSFSTRWVKAVQHGRTIFTLSASFCETESGMEHQVELQPSIPDPETLPDFAERMERHRAAVGDFVDQPRPIDIRYCEVSPFDRFEKLPPIQNVWLRANGKLPEDPVLQVCVLTYASDLTLLDTSLLAHGRNLATGDVFMASLDHAMWFHHPFRADEWLLFAQDSPVTSGGRGLGRGLVYDQSGRLVASAVQEGLVRDFR
jgi:acyl-CoA thioesterase-2